MVYLNTPRCGLIPERILEVGFSSLASLAVLGSRSSQDLHSEHWQSTKTICRQLIGNPDAQIALLPNFSFGINSLASSLPSGSRVLLFRNDYPGLLLAFQSKNFEITWLESDDNDAFDPKDIKAAIDEGSLDVVAISHVQYSTGQTLDLEDLASYCLVRGVEFIVDATQSFGQLKLEMYSGISALLTSGYKWLNAGYGNGLMAIAPAFLERHTPKTAGHGSTTYKKGVWTYSPGIKSYEPGHIAADKVAMLHEALLVQNEIGIEHIQTTSLAFASEFRKQLLLRGLISQEENDILSGSAIVTYKANQNHFDSLSSSGVICTFNFNRIRVGFHYRNTDDDLARMLEEIDSAKNAGVNSTDQ